MDYKNSFIIQHSFISDENSIVAHLYSSYSGHSLNLNIIQNKSKKNYGLVNYVDINNKKVLRRELLIFVNEKNFSDYKIIFLMGLVWRIEFNFEDDISISDFFSIDEECEIPISDISFSYQSTHKSLREISNDLGGLLTQFPKLLSEVKELKNILYILSAVIIFMFFLK